MKPSRRAFAVGFAAIALFASCSPPDRDERGGIDSSVVKPDKDTSKGRTGESPEGGSLTGHGSTRGAESAD